MQYSALLAIYFWHAWTSLMTVIWWSDKYMQVLLPSDNILHILYLWKLMNREGIFAQRANETFSILGQDLPLFPIDQQILPAVKKRVSLTRQIDVASHRSVHHCKK